ncbi:MAG TPA: 3-deoxy-manno-octulosonate cytidylyltransferase [Acidobacteriaceae bacterium]
MNDPHPRILGVIPARLASTRLPRKVLRTLCGQPLLAWVVEAALRCPEFSQPDQIVIAADSEEVAELCAARDWRCLMTSPDLPSGSDRLFAVARQIPADIYVNIQADEPLLQPGHIESLLNPFTRPEVAVTTLKVRCPDNSLTDPNVVKVVTAPDGRALYFSRATIPYDRDGHGTTCWKHLGLYAYRRSALERFASLPPAYLEQVERLEQLRLLENNIDIHVAEAPADTIGVDTEDDLHKVEALLRRRLNS